MINPLVKEIEHLKNEKNASILAHFYQESSVQDIADHIDDSLGMAKYGESSDADILLVAGVLFMGETAKILSPEKTVLVPDLNAGCSLADNCPADKFSEFIKQHPNHRVVTYVNCSAEVKAMSDILCTSSNALKVIESIPPDEPIIFGPDKHLGNYLQKISGRQMVLWDGACIVHENFKAETLFNLKNTYKNALVLAHPECPASVLELADHIGSTSSLLAYSKNSPAKEFIVVTEAGIIHQMKKASPEKIFHALPNNELCNCAECPFMRLNSLEKIRNALRDLSPKVLVPEETRIKALIPLKKMLSLGKQPTDFNQNISPL
ncbi:MAG TPA: quinolinate synthase NadA [Oligoflexia bacterium]|nr:quinolinate synthase NadA [Oligoflexia bacterium]HMP47301.1 quinolinate synthase NadA [Oligoflexia bacterium]